VHGLEAYELFGFVASFDVADAYFKSEDILREVHDLDKTPFEGSCNVFMNEESPGLDFDNNVLFNLLDHFHVLPIYLQPSPYPEYCIDVPINNHMICDAIVDLGYEDKMFNMFGGNVDKFMSLGYFSGYNASLDPYFMYLVDVPSGCTKLVSPML